MQAWLTLWRDNAERLAFIAAALATLIAVAFAASLSPRALGYAGADDALFVRLAQHITQGEWLGPYDEFTLVKGAFYPMFIAASAMAGLPLLVAQQIVTIVVAGVAALALRRLGLPKSLTLLLFVLLALSPVAWHPDLVRVTREPLYANLGLAVFAFAALVLLKQNQTPSARMRALAGFSVAFAAFWLTREESVWLYPALAVLALVPATAAIFGWWRHGFPRGRLKQSAGVLALQAAGLVLPFAALAGGVAALNQAYYGSFITNEVREGAMPSAYGALLRIEEAAPAPRIFFAGDAAAHAYRASTAAAELRPSLDGARGENWRRIGCEALALSPCPTGFGGGWFMWALREAAREAGHMKDAGAAQAFFARLATEINTACDAGKIPCGGARDGMTPPLLPAHLAALPKRIDAALQLVLRFGFGDVGAAPSQGTPEQLALFREMVGEIAPVENVPSPSPALKTLASAYAFLVPFLFLAGLLMLGVALLRAKRVPLNAALFVVALASLTAVTVRAVLIAFIDVTSWDAVNVQYMLPAAPFVLILAVVGIYLGARVPTSITPLKKAANAS